MSRINELSGNTGSSKLLSIAVLVLSVLVFIVWLIHIGAEAQAALGQQRSAEMLAESQALCAKWGVQSGSQKQIECLADIQAIRDHHEQRILQDNE